MKRINYLIVAMLMAFTMVGCQFDPTYLENKISGLEKSDKEQNERLDSIESRLAVLEDKVVDADTMLEDLKVWAVDNLKGKDGLNGKDGKDGVDGKDRLNLTVAQIEQIQADLKTWFEENKSLFKGDKGDKGEDGKDGKDGKDGVSADSTKIAKLESDIATLIDRIATVEDLLKVNDKLETKLSDLIADINNKADATTILTIDNIKTWYDNYTDKFNSLDLSAYLTVANAKNTYATKSSVDEVASNLAELTSRVKTLEDLLDTESDFMKSISTMKLVLGNAKDGDFAKVVNDFNDLKNAVKENTDKLAYKIGDEDYSIEKLAEKVKTLYEVKDAYKSYCDSAVSGLAKISDIPSLENYAQKTEVLGLVKSYIDTEVAKVTVDTSDFLTSDSLSNYATKTELASKLDASAINVTDITSRLATLETVEKAFYRKYRSPNNYYFAYYKIGNLYIGYEDVNMDRVNNKTFEEVMNYASNLGLIKEYGYKLVVTTTPTLK